jgi:hypothetical protein
MATNAYELPRVASWRTQGTVMSFAEIVMHWFAWGFFLSEWAIRLVSSLWSHSGERQQQPRVGYC